MDTHTEPIDSFDLETLAEVRRLHSRLDPVPEGLADRAKFALTMQGLEAEIAELSQPDLALTRSDEVARAQSVTFTSSSLDVMVTITVITIDEARVDGWATVPGAEVRLHLSDTDLTETADEAGRFVFATVGRGTARLVVQPVGDEHRPVVTPTFEI